MTPTRRALSYAVALLLGATSLAAQGTSRSAESLYADASAEESAVRKALATSRPSPTVLKAVRTVVLDYEAFVRRHADSSYADDALWRGALLASDAFRAFGDPQEQQSATRLLKLLTSQYPSSKLARQSPALLAELSVLPSKAPTSVDPPAAVPTRAATPSPTSASAVAPAAVPVATPAATAGISGAKAAPPERRSNVSEPPVSTPPARERKAEAKAASESPTQPGSVQPVATIRGIRRVALPDVVRVIIELDREVSFRDERLANPERVFVDLPRTETARDLRDQTLRFDGDTDPVRQIRLGRHPKNTTRVVLEADAVSSYSVYSLYNPFRLVIDCLREQPAAQLAASVSAPAPRPLPAVVPAVAAAVTPVPVQAAIARSMPAPPPVAAALSPLPSIARPPAPAPRLTARRVESWSRTAPRAVSRQAAAIRALDAAAMPSEPPHVPVTAATIASLPVTPSIAAPSRMLNGGFSLARQLGLRVSRIVIDPGHGGHDPGAKGGGANEAELVLDVALRLEKLFQSSADMEVILTRRKDEYVTLQERTAIANRENADLFLSIHANASNAASARGVETYFLNFASNLSAAATAARENAASGQSMGELPDVVKAIALNNKLEESKDFATYVQREMVTRLGGAKRGPRDLGVKQAPFQVLIGAAMPSVLAEIAFLSNAQESRLVRQPAYRQRIAEALFNAVRTYQNSLSHASTARLDPEEQ